jgi:hypothetical protein
MGGRDEFPNKTTFTPSDKTKFYASLEHFSILS